MSSAGGKLKNRLGARARGMERLVSRGEPTPVPGTAHRGLDAPVTKLDTTRWGVKKKKDEPGP